MGMMGNMGVAQAEMMDMPCHETEVVTEKNMESNCSACVDSENLWSQDFISTNKDIVLQDFAPAVLPVVWGILEFQPIETVDRESVPDPPDIAFYASPLRAQKGIVLLN